MDGLSVIKKTIGRPSFTTTYVGFDAGSIRDIPNPTGPTGTPGPTGLFMTFGMGETEALRAIDSGQFNPTDPTLPFTKFGFFWNGVLIFGIEVAMSIKATFCGINNDNGEYRLGRWTWIENNDYKRNALKDARLLPRRQINLYDTHTKRPVPTNVGLSDVTYVNAPNYETTPWFCPIDRNVAWLGSKPAINMLEFDWFISVLLDRAILPSHPPAAEAATEAASEAVKTIFGDNEYMNDELEKYTKGYNALLRGDKKKDQLSGKVKEFIQMRKAILAEQKYRVEILNRISKIILLMKDSEPLLHFYELWLEMMKKTMRIDVPNIPLFQNTDTRLLDYGDVGDIGDYHQGDRSSFFFRDESVGLSSGSSSESSSRSSWNRDGDRHRESDSRSVVPPKTPLWNATETYESKYGSIAIEDPNKLCRANSDEIKKLLNKLYHSKTVEDAKSLLTNKITKKILFLGLHPDQNIGCNELSTVAFQELQGLRDFPSSAGGSGSGRGRKHTRRKSRKVRRKSGRRRHRRTSRK